MTDHAGLIERLQDGPPRDYDIAGQVRGFRVLADEAASAIASLVKERDALKIESSKHAYGADKAKQDRDTAERRSEDFWSGRVASAEARCARMKEALRPFAEAAEELPEHIHDLVPVVLTTDEEDNPKTIVHIEDFRRARQALEEQG